MTTVRVFNLRTQQHLTYTAEGMTPERAVIAAHAQSRNDYNTWSYRETYGHMLERSPRAVYCGDCGAYLQQEGAQEA